MEYNERPNYLGTTQVVSDFVFKRMEFVLRMMYFVFKMMNFGRGWSWRSTSVLLYTTSRRN